VTVWVGKPLVLAIHDRQLAEHGGNPGVRDEGLLDAAVARPRQLHAHGDPPPDLAALAANLAHGLVRSHPFIDGNKRTAHVCYRVFLRLNGADLVAPAEAKYVALLGLAEGSIDEARFAAWVRAHLVPGSGVVHEAQVVYSKP